MKIVEIIRVVNRILIIIISLNRLIIINNDYLLEYINIILIIRKIKY